MIKTICIALCVLTWIPVGAQNLAGSVVDAETSEKLSYVSMGIVGKPAGTVSGAEGDYSFPIDPKYDGDSIRISLIGYRSRSFSVKDFKKQHELGAFRITLKKEARTLDEVVIRPKLKRKKLGHSYNNRSIILGLATGAKGTEIAAYVNIKEQSGIISKLNIHIAENQFDSVLLRVNVYDVKNGLPDQIILKKPVYFTLKQKHGELTIDLKDQTIFVKEDFYISVEWISNIPSRVLSFCAGFRGSHAVRVGSEDTWERIDSFGLGIGCEIVY